MHTAPSNINEKSDWWASLGDSPFYLLLSCRSGIFRYLVFSFSSIIWQPCHITVIHVAARDGKQCERRQSLQFSLGFRSPFPPTWLPIKGTKVAATASCHAYQRGDPRYSAIAIAIAIVADFFLLANCLRPVDK